MVERESYIEMATHAWLPWTSQTLPLEYKSSGCGPIWHAHSFITYLGFFKWLILFLYEDWRLSSNYLDGIRRELLNKKKCRRQNNYLMNFKGYINIMWMELHMSMFSGAFPSIQCISRPTCLINISSYNSPISFFYVIHFRFSFYTLFSYRLSPNYCLI